MTAYIWILVVAVSCHVHAIPSKLQLRFLSTETQHMGNQGMPADLRAQRRMDADEELLEQMPFSTNRRMDSDALPFSQLMSFLAAAPPQHQPQQPQIAEIMAAAQMPIVVPIQFQAQPRLDMQKPLQQAQQQQQQPFPMLQVQTAAFPNQNMVPEMQGPPIFQATGPMPGQIFADQMSAAQNFQQFPMENVFQPAMPQVDMFVPQQPMRMEATAESRSLAEENEQMEEQQKNETPISTTTASPSSTPAEQPLAVETERQRIVVMNSAARLRPVVIDSLQTVMRFFNAVVPETGASSPLPIPLMKLNMSQEQQRQPGGFFQDDSMEGMTQQIADALSALTAQAKRLLPLIVDNMNKANVSAGIVDSPNSQTEQPATPSPESKSDLFNEIRAELKESQSTSEAPVVTHMIHINSDDFRRTWKHLVHNYWQYVQKVLQSLQQATI